MVGVSTIPPPPPPEERGLDVTDVRLPPEPPLERSESLSPPNNTYKTMRTTAPITIVLFFIALSSNLFFPILA